MDEITQSAGRGSEVSVADFLEAGKRRVEMELCSGEAGLSRKIAEAAINRPGLALTGFYQYFPQKRMQVIGLSENAYLSSLDVEGRTRHLTAFFESRIPCVVFTRNRRLPPEVIELSEKNKVPVLRSRMVTKYFVNAATLLMENLMAQHVKFQGTMIEINGVGVLIEGKPGVGKSETALALIEKGHSLISDDVTLLRVDSSGSVIGASVDVTRYHMEIRGLGIIHVPSLFGVTSVRDEKRLDIVVSLYRVDERESDDRRSGSRATVNVLGVEVPHVEIPVAPGRALSNLVEAAALDQKLRTLGHDAAKELDEKLITTLTEASASSE
mgnify:CR=1 FL=1|tara:strand:- start:708 stop:1685 length:978 start_codon:yes stop_codon:yes gene_type:complete